MRLDKLTIGGPTDSPAHQYKNLKNVTIDFDQDQWVTVMIGWNGTGKSNVLEALAIIFREFISKKPKIEFAFKLAYRTGSGKATRHILIDADPDRDRDAFIIYVATNDEAEGIGSPAPFIESEETLRALRGKRLKLQAFLNDDEQYLPRHVFSYYSGESTRMYEVFLPYLEDYDSKLRSDKDPGLKRLFYAMPVHSKFVLLAFLIQKSKVVREFLDEHLGLDPDEGIESVLFVMRQPPWSSREGDPRFWNARGIVTNFLSKLYDIALAPITVTRRVPTSIWNKETLEFKYLFFVKDIQSLRKLVGNQRPEEFFRDLESTYVSELIEDVRIRVRLKKNENSVTFRELSEGEQQLLTVLGLMCFTAGKESLFLLDEPDTHLNPKWCVDYIEYLQKFAGTDMTTRETSHIILTSHNPLSIAELAKEQVQILRLNNDDEKRRVVACYPDMDPRGQGYAAIITSDMFGIASSLDKSTQALLEKQRLYAGKPKLNTEELRDLDKINAQLERLGFRFILPDDEYSRYLRLRYHKLAARFNETNLNKAVNKVLSMSRNEREQLATELIEDLMRGENKGKHTSKKQKTKKAKQIKSKSVKAKGRK